MLLAAALQHQLPHLRSRAVRAHALVLQAEPEDLMAEEGLPPADAPAEGETDGAAESSPFTVEGWKRKREADAAKGVTTPFDFPSFDFSGTQSEPTAVRGQGGLDEQGFEPTRPGAADSPAEKGIGGIPTYQLGLGMATVAIALLSASNAVS